MKVPPTNEIIVRNGAHALATFEFEARADTDITRITVNGTDFVPLHEFDSAIRRLVRAYAMVSSEVESCDLTPVEIVSFLRPTIRHLDKLRGAQIADHYRNFYQPVENRYEIHTDADPVTIAQGLLRRAVSKMLIDEPLKADTEGFTSIPDQPPARLDITFDDASHYRTSTRVVTTVHVGGQQIWPAPECVEATIESRVDPRLTALNEPLAELFAAVHPLRDPGNRHVTLSIGDVLRALDRLWEAWHYPPPETSEEDGARKNPGDELFRRLIAASNDVLDAYQVADARYVDGADAISEMKPPIAALRELILGPIFDWVDDHGSET